MTTTNRRRVLFGLAAASTAAATGTTAATAAIRENPELIALGDATASLQNDYIRARNECRRIEEEYAPKWPLAPAAILSFGGGCKDERDLTGAGITRVIEGRGDMARMWRYAPPPQLEDRIRQHQANIAHIMTTKSKRGLKRERLWLSRAQEALPLSRDYTAEIERLRSESGYEAAAGRKVAAMEALRDHITRVMETDAATMEGVVIKAQALLAWSQVDWPFKAVNFDGATWAEELAGAILRQAGEG